MSPNSRSFATRLRFRKNLLITGLLVIASGVCFTTLTHRVKAATTWNVAVGSPGACTIAAPNCATITAAIAAASSGDTINVAFGTYNEHDIAIAKDLTISGAGANTTIVDAQQLGRVFNITAGTSTISGLTIKNGLTANGSNGSNGTNGGNGGGITNSGTLNLTSCTVSNNATGNGGSGVLFARAPNPNPGFANFVRVGFTSPGPAGIGGQGGLGGGIFNQGVLTLLNCTVSTNQTGNGGNGSTTGGNGGDGGGIYNLGTVTVTNSTIANNQTGSGGSVSTPTVVNPDNNTAITPSITITPGNGGEGGGIANGTGGTLNLRNSTIANNQTGPCCGSIGVIAAKRANGDVPSTPVSVSGGNGGGVYTGGSVTTANVQSTIIANNAVAAGGTGPDVFSDITITSQGFNLIGKTDGSSGFTQPTDQTGTIGAALDPMLSPLANNGGPTQTMALLTGSPAIDKGVNPGCAGAPSKTPTVNFACGLPFDQRGTGFPRTSDNGAIAPAAGGDNTDIGAFEVQFGGPCAPDTTPPSITCPGSITKFTDSGQLTATVNPGTPVATDNCALQSVTGVRSDGKALNAPYPIGVTLITWTATDVGGNTATCGQSIAVMVPSGPGGRRIPE